MFDFLFSYILLTFDALFRKEDKFKRLFKCNNTIFAVIFISFLVGLIFKWWFGLFFVFIALLYICIKVYLCEKKPNHND